MGCVFVSCVLFFTRCRCGAQVHFSTCCHKNVIAARQPQRGDATVAAITVDWPIVLEFMTFVGKVFYSAFNCARAHTPKRRYTHTLCAVARDWGTPSSTLAVNSFIGSASAQLQQCFRYACAGVACRSVCAVNVAHKLFNTL